jgi:hypothetical protein
VVDAQHEPDRRCPGALDRRCGRPVPTTRLSRQTDPQTAEESPELSQPFRLSGDLYAWTMSLGRS